jgi:hypothetical protein
MIRACTPCVYCKRRTVARQMSGACVRNCCRDANPDAPTETVYRTRSGKRSTPAQTLAADRLWRQAYDFAVALQVGSAAERAAVVSAVRRPCGPSDGVLLASLMHWLSPGDRADLLAALIVELES